MPSSPDPTARPLDALLRDELAAIDRAALRRTLRPMRRREGATLLVDDREVVDFASNDYLGLAADPRLAGALRDALDDVGVGAGAARLVTGDDPLHERLESAIAALKGTERALLFASGFAANVGVLPALAGRDDAIYSDALNHASIVDGCRLSRAAVRVFPHGDVDALDAMLRADAGGARFRRRWIVVEGVYSMDGDLFPLDRLVSLARAHGAYTVVDDAHASGVLGTGGRGTASHFGVDGAIDVTVGTLGKAFGTAGAFVAGSAALCDLLLHRARSFVFTTGSPPAVAAATLRALAIARDEPWRRDRLRDNARRLRAGLAALGRPAPGEADGHVVPVLLGDPTRTVDAGARLLADGFAVGAIRPPSVPPGSARLRLSVSAAHTPEQIDALLEALAAVPGVPNADPVPA
ncbi:8-amino-7-oxononanoate synthase [Gemmatirosa kalamazoonensis]|uniref:8-amino-7-ketopelargonate synthase n=1 Tax=Gemmatirosa kalamazoonensis TaxID=861299 RepID=W0RNV0_9BACT|nr:8-amino-7-oxononanoate synthase [Gemmatirosa kalamazoonensis]AHG92025.1 8-amino-7-oxononanoate synthase [Gemmatirosa kalamazoonensis]